MKVAPEERLESHGVRLPPATAARVREIADEEARSFSSAVALLLREALDARSDARTPRRRKVAP